MSFYAGTPVCRPWFAENRREIWELYDRWPWFGTARCEEVASSRESGPKGQRAQCHNSVRCPLGVVVRECYKGDDASRWGNGKFDPLPRPNLLIDRHQKLHTWLRPAAPVPDTNPHAKFSHDPSRVSFPVCAKLRIKNVYSVSFFRVLPTAHSSGPWTDFHAKYVKRRGSAQGCAFSGLENNNLTFPRPLFPKNRHFGPA